MREHLVTALVLVVAISGCGPGAAAQPTIRAVDVARQLGAATGLSLRAVPPPPGFPGLPELATTLSGGTQYESLTVFVFFESRGTERVLGSGRKPAGRTVLVSSNVVVLYRSGPGATDKSRQVRRALDALIAGA